MPRSPEGKVISIPLRGPDFDYMEHILNKKRQGMESAIYLKIKPSAALDLPLFDQVPVNSSKPNSQNPI
jgi:hypothetical protein